MCLIGLDCKTLRRDRKDEKLKLIFFSEHVLVGRKLHREDYAHTDVATYIHTYIVYFDVQPDDNANRSKLGGRQLRHRDKQIETICRAKFPN